MTAPAAIVLCFNCFATFPAEEAVYALRPGHVFCPDCIIAKAWSVVGNSKDLTCSERTAAILLEAELTGERGRPPQSDREQASEQMERCGASLEGAARYPGAVGVDFWRGEPLDSEPHSDWRLTRAEEE